MTRCLWLSKLQKIFDKGVLEIEERGLTLFCKKIVAAVFSKKQVKSVSELRVKNDIMLEDQYVYLGGVLTSDRKFDYK